MQVAKLLPRRHLQGLKGLLGEQGPSKAQRSFAEAVREEAVEVSQAAARTKDVASTSGREYSNGRWQELMMTLYKVRGEALVKHNRMHRDRSNKYLRHLDDDHLLLPLKVLTGAQEFSSIYYRQFRLEVHAMKRHQRELMRDFDRTMKRGAGAELRSSQSIIKSWMPVLTEAIRAEQLAILNKEPALDRQSNGPHLLLLSAEDLANVTLHGLLGQALSGKELGHMQFSLAAFTVAKLVKRNVDMDLLRIKGQRVARQRQALLKALKEQEDPRQAISPAELESIFDPDDPLKAAVEGNSNLGLWFQRWYESLKDDPEFAKTEDEELREVLVDRLRDVHQQDFPQPTSGSGASFAGHDILDRIDPRDKKRVKDRHKLETKEMAADTNHTMNNRPHEDGQLSGLKFRPQFRPGSATAMTPARERTILARFLGRMMLATQDWDQVKLVKVGARLLHIAKDTLTIDVKDKETGEKSKQAALYHKIVFTDAMHAKHYRRQGILRVNDHLMRQFQEMRTIEGLFESVHDPMLIPPIPWKGADFGAYLITKSLVLRPRGTTQLNAIRLADHTRKRIDKVYDALNVLGEVPWKVNRENLTLLNKARNERMGICGLPPSDDIPILLPQIRKRFMLLSGGYMTPSDSRAGDGKAAEEELMKYLAAEKQESGSSKAVPDQAFPSTTEEVEIAAVMDGNEGSSLSRHTARLRYQFKRTQLLATMTDKETLYEKKLRRSANAKIRKINRENFSLRSAMTLKAEVAQKFSREKALYYPHNLDFRGRAYPIHPHLNHLGDDVCRGLLQFAEKKPLGKEGLDWLLVHGANLWANGVDKLPLHERRHFIIDNLDYLQKSAKAPFECTWWHGAEDPWQFLGAIRDITRAVNSENPEAYESCIPVAMDGSCNGLQHYAALARDEPGGFAVNVVPSDRPQDVYSQVADLVREHCLDLDADSSSGQPLAKLLAEVVDRKLVKQTVMTSVYGVTFVGAREQIQRRLKERGFDENHKPDSFTMASFAARQVLRGLHVRFENANMVMQWLNDCAKEIASKQRLVEWKTPLGLPVIQEYYKPVKRHVLTSLQRCVLIHETKNKGVDASRQRSAFPPNFIHSLDSSHMMMTAIAAKKAGIRFAGVHDSFWTHACDVDTLNRVLRESFIELYSKPILEDLLNSFEQRYQMEFPPLPPKGTLDLNCVRDSTYFFS